ncbi:hypothetical protein N7450_003828 [Penicillium hetheringtonii]|uniref:Uncharacterized protein n=1 Tax=Penicillium hetheringtonii TaxID=911720 RepID=A0AAD6DNX6_9EURO|nr:hypothetical protein N7450_003828 [Penicillium hetheringtonii]
MLSDCSEMISAETAIRTPSGNIRKIRGPSMGTAVIMQGHYIEHQALKAIGGLERISMVTPFRPREPSVRDELVLTGSQAISNRSELYHGFIYECRLELLEERTASENKRRAETNRYQASIQYSRYDCILERAGFLLGRYSLGTCPCSRNGIGLDLIDAREIPYHCLCLMKRCLFTTESWI